MEIQRLALCLFLLMQPVQLNSSSPPPTPNNNDNDPQPPPVEPPTSPAPPDPASSTDRLPRPANKVIPPPNEAVPSLNNDQSHPQLQGDNEGVQECHIGTDSVEVCFYYTCRTLGYECQTFSVCTLYTCIYCAPLLF